MNALPNVGSVPLNARIRRAAEHRLVMELIYAEYGIPCYPLETEAAEAAENKEAQEENAPATIGKAVRRFSP